MAVEWNDILQLPARALMEPKRVPKTQLERFGQLTRSQVKLLDKFKAITQFANLTKTNSYIQPVKDDEHHIENVLFLRCDLAASTGAAEALHVAHDCFPNPTVLLVDGIDKGTIGVSVAIRRKSRSEHGAFVLEREVTSGLFNPEEASYEVYLSRIAFGELPQTTLLAYVSALADRTSAARTVKQLGFYPRCKDADVGALMGHVKRLQAITLKVNELQAERKRKGATLAETSKIRVKLRDLEKERADVRDQIKELCV